MNTKFVLGLPKTKQVGLKRAKNIGRCERWRGTPPPPGYEHDHGFNDLFLEPCLKNICESK